jgi:hypothetical protein
MLCEILEIMERETTLLPQEIAGKLDVSDETLKMALEHLTMLGYLRVITQTSNGCAGCRGCGNGNGETLCNGKIKWFEKTPK